jgi:hypothetical protein
MQFDSDLHTKKTLSGGKHYQNPRVQDEETWLSGFVRNACKERTLHHYYTLSKFNNEGNVRVT